MGFADIHGLLMQMVQPLLPMEIFLGYKRKRYFQWKIIATSGTIGDIEIYEDHIGTTSTPNSSGSGQWAGLSIYKDFSKLAVLKGM